jgi:hypothetical protein
MRLYSNSHAVTKSTHWCLVLRPLANAKLRRCPCKEFHRVPLMEPVAVRFLMSTGDTDDPQHWRERAAQMRSLAVKMAGCEAAILIDDLAADYEKLAEQAEIKANGKKPRSNGKLR